MVAERVMGLALDTNCIGRSTVQLRRLMTEHELEARRGEILLGRSRGSCV